MIKFSSKNKYESHKFKGCSYRRVDLCNDRNFHIGWLKDEKFFWRFSFPYSDHKFNKKLDSYFSSELTEAVAIVDMKLIKLFK